MTDTSNTIAPTSFIGKNVVLGKNIKIWNMSYIGNDTEIGDNVIIGSLAHIDYNVKIGSDTKIEGLVYVAPKCIIGKNVFIGPSATLTNDPYPPSKKLEGVLVKDDAVIGARSVIKSGVTVGENSVIAMGSIVVKNVPDNTVVLGSPAKVLYSRADYDEKLKNWERTAKY